MLREGECANRNINAKSKDFGRTSLPSFNYKEKPKLPNKKDRDKKKLPSRLS